MTGLTPDIDTLRRLDKLERRSSQVYDQIACTYVPLTTALTETGGALAGAALNIGTYTVGPQGSGATYTFNYPMMAKAVKFRLSAAWAAASNTSIAYLIPNGGNTDDIAVYTKAFVAGYGDLSAGDVALDSSALAQLVVAGANTTICVVKVLGYFL